MEQVDDNMLTVPHKKHSNATNMNQMRDKKLTEVDTVSSYSAMMHPNEDLSDLGSPKEEQPVKLGRFKRMVAWIDENWLKKLLVKHDSE